MVQVSKKMLVMIVAIASVVLIVGFPSHRVLRAQGDLGDDELALLDRVTDAMPNIESYSSFVSQSLSIQEHESSLDIEGYGTFFLSEDTNLSATTTYILSDDVENIQSDLALSSEFNDDTSGTAYSYALTAEVRFVDDTLYVISEYLNSEGEVPDVPDGWMTLNQIELGSIYENLDLYTYFGEEDTGAFAIDNLLHDRDRLETVVESVTIDQGVLDDETEVDIITIVVDPIEFAVPLLEVFDLGTSDIREVASVALTVGEANSITYEVILDSDDNVRRAALVGRIQLDGLSLSLLGDLPEGIEGTFTFKLEATESVDYSDINAELKPVEAPE